MTGSIFVTWCYR